jgi:Cu+-exporting ATPase
MDTNRAIGHRLGIAEALGGRLPSEKAEFVSDLQKRENNVLMVGDGINDAPALV